MLNKLIIFLASLLVCSQLAAAEFVEQLEGTNFDSNQAINSKIEIKLLSLSDEEERELVADHFRDYLQNQDSTAFADALEEMSNKGYFLTSEVTGYIIRYAWSEELEEGKRLVMLCKPGLKSLQPNIWKEPNPNPTIYRGINPDYKDFTLIEVLINNEEGIIKTSLDTDILLREDNKLALSNFSDTRAFGVLN